MFVFIFHAVCSFSYCQKVLFDGRHGETAGNADWIVDADTSLQYWDTYTCAPGYYNHSAQQIPTPPQSGITLATPETYWDGGISAWAMDLVHDSLDPGRNRTWEIEQYPWDAPPFTFGDAGNPQDLSNYDVLILCEPNVAFTPGEITAILDFVWNGGGLFMVADHETSDRNCSGGGVYLEDSPYILNLLMGCNVNFSPTLPYFDPLDTNNDYGVFGIWFHENGNDDSGDLDNKEFDWFDEAVNDNVETDPSDPIINGPFGNGSGGLGFFGSTQMTICNDSVRGNPTVKAHVWRNGQSHNPNGIGVSDRVTFASASYGAGRVVAIGDSSPADDNTGEGTLYPGWDLASGGVNNDIIHLNATEWIANPVPDTDPPVIETGPTATPSDCSALISWTTDENATSTVYWGLTAGLGSETTVAGYTKNHSVTVGGLTPDTTYFYKVSSLDLSGNGPAQSTVVSFTTISLIPVNITAGPSVSNLQSSSADIAWTTDKAGDSTVYYGITAGMGSSRNNAALVSSHMISLTSLLPENLYYYQVETTDSCGQVVQSAQDTFTTPAVPPQTDISGWTIYQYDSSQSFTFDPGTVIPSNGYLVLARNSTQGDFELEWGTLPPGVIFVNSGESCPMINGAESFELKDDVGTTIDGPTISMASGNSIQRNNPGDDSGTAGSWTVDSLTSATPGSGAGTLSGAGVVINEASDASDYPKEFIELFYDAGGAPDTDPPVILTGPDSAPGDCTAYITWTTDENSDSVVEYGLTDPPSIPVNDATLVTSHSINLTGLSTGTMYYFKASSTDASSNGPAWSSTGAFTTTSSSPVLSNIGSSSVTVDSVLISWNTNESSSRTVDYGETTGYGSTSGSGTGTTHSVQLSGLTPDTLYHYRVRSTDDCGLETVSGDYTFSTLPPDTSSPAAVTDLTAEVISPDTVRLAWTAPGDDGTDGTAALYIVRLSAGEMIMEFDTASDVSGEPSPSAAGTPESFDIPGLSFDTTYIFALKTEDEVPNLSSVSNTARATTGPSGGGTAAEHVVISEVQTRGAADHNDEFIEIYNPTSTSVDISGWSLQYKSDTGTTYTVIPLSPVSIPSGGYWLVARASSYTGSVTPDQTQSVFLMGASGGHVFLANTTSQLGSCTSASIVDKVAWGSGNCPETAVITAHGAGESLERKPGMSLPTCGNGQDTDDNSADFDILITPDPQNSNYSESPCGSLGNVGITLFMNGNTLTWTESYGATGYKIRRSISPDFMTTNPVPDDTNLLVQTSGNTADDLDDPLAGQCFFYFVNAVNATDESEY